ncbi:isoaspartyl peptidase/L-asparaginase family protein [Schlesneria paludicola]|uniref:isoaspartyl peptidase/L-asparaginase family protein n=1 Tax=Schlesneria paludicola TaxID=360056 RepID=UPI00029B529F|nr:isoaspartyl peptidase/L-asparaginase [Schlesneria paludicola]
MIRWLLSIGVAILALGNCASAGDDVIPNVVLGIHGGIGEDKKDMTPEIEARVRAALNAALKAGKAKLDTGGTSLDAVETAIRVMEDDSILNAGRGAVFTHEGRNELDASIMDGKTKKAGAVASVTTVKNPISAARAVMEKTRHVMLIGEGAEVFAAKQGLEIVDPSYFWTEHEWKAILDIWKKEAAARNNGQAVIPAIAKPHLGTVGAVAIDAQRNLAAGTSTGGLQNKMHGRIGDSPIIGAGTYADNEAAAISCTGTGEFFIRFSVSHEIVAQMKYKKVSSKEAAEDVINRQLKELNAEGAAIVLDKSGQFTTARNSEGLYRGWITADGAVTVRIYE